MPIITKDTITRILREAADLGATEIHFKVPKRPLYRIDGSLLPSRHARLLPQDTREVASALSMMADDEGLPKGALEKTVSFGLSGLGRYRASMYQQRGTFAIVIHCVPTTAASLADLGFDARIEPFIGQPGIILVGGSKQRLHLLAALVTTFNATQRGHVVFLEDTLTMLHRDAMASIAHREVGVDVVDFASGIRSAIQQSADLLVINRVDDHITAEALFRAAEEGIPCIAAVASPTAADAGSFLIRNFVGDHRADAKARLRGLLRAVMCIPAHGQVELRIVKQREQAQQQPELTEPGRRNRQLPPLPMV